MRLLKFNLIFIPILALCLGAVGYIARKMLLENAREHVFIRVGFSNSQL